jgi:hypothetical protein
MVGLLRFLVIGLIFCFCSSAFSVLPKYVLAVDFLPEEKMLDVHGEILNLPDGALGNLYLNKDFKILSVSGENPKEKIDVILDIHSESPEYIRVAKRMVFPAQFKTKKLNFHYRGAIREPISDINMLSSSLIELALYSGWYPILKGQDHFEFEVHVRVPKQFAMASNGHEESMQAIGQFKDIRFKSTMPTNDIVLIGAPLLQKRVKTIGTLSFEIFSPKESKVDIEERLKVVGDALKTLMSWYGNASDGLLRFVFSPRGGWGYSRLPLFVVSNERAEQMQKDPMTKAEEIQGNIHELSHFWWQISDPTTPDDWINEGLAEFTSFNFVSDRFGEPVRKYLLTQYFDHIAKSRDNTPILQTKGDSKFRYVNRYEKTTILFCLLKKKFGQEKLFRALRSFYTEFRGTRKANTNRFLEILKQQLGVDASRLAEDLLGSAWTDKQSETAKNELL